MIEHISLDKTDRKHSLSQVTVNDETVIVKWWYSTKNKVTEDEFNDFLVMKALFQLGEFEQARDVIANGAQGSLTVDENGVETDTRNQRQKWLDGLFS
ncbi:hypothetical protein UFOVP453_58 [uncultured Caudovirales phage]|uniref:Uncharacterized protein n=1 Tax=uncultured Caudovirales phage TaxID=2100421 RepID=A0A6J5MEL4_9CAUD|nr:hypothetical protein UFOVP453_58 [uncultured Caudovirales phage]